MPLVRKVKNRMIGSFGDVICFSFDGIKNITSGEGGCIVSSDDVLVERVKNARLLGVEKDTDKRFKCERSWKFNVKSQGYRYHMSDLFAAIGLVQLKKINEFKEKRQFLSKRYVEQLKKINNLTLLNIDYDEVIPHIFPLKVASGERDSLFEFMKENGVQCGIHYYPNHLLSYYSVPEMCLPVTEQVYSEIISLPLHPELSAKEQDEIVKLVSVFMQNRS